MVSTPRLQPESLRHHAWGSYKYDTTPTTAVYAGRVPDPGGSALPNSVNNALGADHFYSLLVGDRAVTTSVSSGDEVGHWFCVYPGTVGGGDAVWARTDLKTTATIRDSATIVVGKAPLLSSGTPATDELIQIDAASNVAGTTCDILDPGDATGIQSAMAIASALRVVGWSGVSVVLRDGDYVLASGYIEVPSYVRVRGEGREGTVITGDGTVFHLLGRNTIEHLGVVSRAKELVVAGSFGGAVTCTGSAKVEAHQLNDLRVHLLTDADRGLSSACVGISMDTAERHGTVVIRDCEFESDGPFDSAGTPNPLFAVSSDRHDKLTLQGVNVRGLCGGVRLRNGTYPDPIENTTLTGCYLDVAAYGVYAKAEERRAIVGVSMNGCRVIFRNRGSVPLDHHTVVLADSEKGTVQGIDVTGCTAEWWLSGVDGTTLSGLTAWSVLRHFPGIPMAGSGVRQVSFSGCSTVYIGPPVSTRSSTPKFGVYVEGDPPPVMPVPDMEVLGLSVLGCAFGGFGGAMQLSNAVYLDPAVAPAVEVEHAHPKERYL